MCIRDASHDREQHETNIVSTIGVYRPTTSRSQTKQGGDVDSPDGPMLRPLKVAQKRISTPWRRVIYTTVGASLAGSVVFVASLPRGNDGLTSTAAAKVCSLLPQAQ